MSWNRNLDEAPDDCRWLLIIIGREYSIALKTTSGDWIDSNGGSIPSDWVRAWDYLPEPPAWVKQKLTARPKS